jgi:uncharacterized membrane protein YfcA
VYGIESDFWLRLASILLLYSLLLFFLNLLLRKWLNVKRKKFFSYNHINEKHKKVDWMIRITFMIALLIGYFINITRSPEEQITFLQPYILIFIFLVVSETARAIMERRYAENKNDYVFTVSQMVFNAGFLLSLFSTNFFGWFE